MISNESQQCPFCGNDNRCRAASGDCWCFHTKIPIELREQIPEELRGKVCICRKCVEAYKANES